MEFIFGVNEGIFTLMKQLLTQINIDFLFLNKAMINSFTIYRK